MIERILAGVDKAKRGEVTLRNLRHRPGSGGRIVRGLVAGKEIWFASDSVPLRVEPFAYVVAYLISAMKKQRDVDLRMPLNRGEIEGLGRVSALAERWWGFTHAPAVRARPADPSKPPGARGTGQTFSCGVDSFHTLFTHRDAIDYLILIHGFDVPLGDVERFGALRAHAAAVAEATGKKLITIRTNLREHRLFGHGGWGRIHGAALAAVGHLLSDVIDRLYISGSHPSEALEPWGSSPLLDHLWSTDRLDIRHKGDALWRLDKMRVIAGEPLFQKHLVVCWRGKGVPSNCGRCEKCVRNRLGLILATGADASPSFPQGVPLAPAVRALGPLQSLSSVYLELLALEGAEPELKEAVQALIERSYGSKPKDWNEEAMGWSREIVRARIADVGQRRRHEGGSPDPAEIEAYRALVPAGVPIAETTAIVLGMTPELRVMAAGCFGRVIAVDKNRAIVQALRDWLPPELREKERLFAIDWAELEFIDWREFPPVRAVFGDGIFGNLPDEAAHRSFLRRLKQLFPGATFVFRKALAAPGGDPDEAVLEGLRDDFREGRIDADGFGFSVRLRGFLHSHYDAETALLDNAALFEDCERRFAKGYFEAKEIEAIRRFRFDGKNCLLTRAAWEALVQEEGFEFSMTELAGKPWYSFYPIYRLSARKV